MGILPLRFKDAENAACLALTGRESFDITGMGGSLKPGAELKVRATDATGTVKEFTAIVRIDTPEELVAFRHGGILPYVLRQLVGHS